GDLQKQQLPLQAVVLVQLKDLAGHFQPVGLQKQLGDGVLVAVGGDGDAADVGVVGGRDRQAVDVEAAAAEQAGHPRQNAADVIDQNADDPAVRRVVGFRLGHCVDLLTPS